MKRVPSPFGRLVKYVATDPPEQGTGFAGDFVRRNRPTVRIERSRDATSAPSGR